MSALIDLEEPFKSRWRKGYLQTHPNGRKYVKLYNSNSDSSLISYGRYLLCVTMGMLLPPEVDADHIDDNSTNDSVTNLQPLSQYENRRKSVLSNMGKIRIDTAQQCEECGGKIFSSKLRRFCTKSCASTNRIKTKREEGNPIGGKPLSPDIVLDIKRRHADGQSMRSIARAIGVAKETVYKYCK